jgi:hypothetical protein
MKDFKIDVSSVDDIQKHIQILKSYLGSAKKADPHFISKNERCRRIFHYCRDIYETDISSLYEDVILDEERKYYVYVHQNPMYKLNANMKSGLMLFTATLGLEYMPFYVGKGVGDRWKVMNRNDTYSKVKKLINENNKQVLPKIIADRLTEKEALCIESKLIDIYGIISYKGTLTNLDEGYKPNERKLFYLDKWKFLVGKNINMFDIRLQQL